MNPHQRLGIDADADEREIKRAYARALRNTRPDQDAQAFQDLNEAYQAALALRRQADHERWLEQNQDEPAQAADEPAPASAPASATAEDGARDEAAPASGRGEDEGIELSIDQIGNAVIAGALQLAPDDYEAWLHGFPPLYSLYVKGVIAPQLPRALAQAPQLDSRRLETIARFFDLDTLGTLDAQGLWLLERLRQRSRVDFAAFEAELRERACGRDLESFRTWLMYRDEVREPDLRGYVGAMLYHSLKSGLGASLLPPDRLQLVCTAFEFPERSELLLRNNALWAVTREDARAFGHPSPTVVQELKRPFSRWRALRVATLQPDLSQALARLGGQLRQAYGALPPPIDPRQYLFHARLAYRAYWGGWRWAVFALRAALVFLPLWWATDLEFAYPFAVGVLAVQIAWLAYDHLLGHGPQPPRPIRTDPSEQAGGDAPA